jgi:molybdopterin-guanine dinucleotide biosynthesis protein A
MTIHTQVNGTTDSPKHILGVILAGGQSQRMGDSQSLPKALVPLSPVMTMLDRAISVMSQITQDIVVSLPHDPTLQAAFKTAHEDYPAEDFPGLRWLPDDADAFHGPMQGIATVARHFQNQPLLVMCVDQIALKPSLLNTLIPKNPEAQIDVTAFLCDGLAPFPVMLSSHASQGVLKAFYAGERSLSHWLKRQQEQGEMTVRAIPLSVQDMFALASANTLQELSQMQEAQKAP